MKATLERSEVHIGQIGGHGDIVLGSCAGGNAVAAAGNYAANDVISNSATAGAGRHWLFPRAARVPGGTGIINGVFLSFSAQGLLARVRLWLFHTPVVSTELDDNEAFSLTDADVWSLACPPIELQALSDRGAVSATWNIADKPSFRCAEGSMDLHGILEFLDAETNEAAGMICRPALWVLQD